LFFFGFSPPDIPVTSSHEFHRLPSMTLLQNESTIKLSTNTLINDDHNASFEDEDMSDEHLNTIDSQYPPQSNCGAIIKAYALYDFNGKIKNYFFNKF
jgi:hypothetical protein